MADHTENTLRAVNKALTDVVASALDPKDPLAHEQLRLVVDYVNFLRQRLDLLNPRARFDLTQAVEMAEKLVPLLTSAPDVVQEDLNSRITRARGALAAAESSTTCMKDATAAIYGAIRRLMRDAALLSPQTCRQIETTVVAASSRQIEFERTWYAPLGLDPAAGQLPPLDHFLAS